jgi:uncharacterized protein YoxC
MVILLTVASVLAVWALLTVLMLGLLVIFKTLDAVRRNLQQIAMGVRAIEQETAPLGTRAVALDGNLAALTAALGSLAEALERTGRSLAGPAPGSHQP